MRTRNFTLVEIAHRPLGKDITLEKIGCVQMGYMQSIVDFLTFTLKQQVYCKVESGYRAFEVNRALYEGRGQLSKPASTDSNHIWRLQNSYPNMTDVVRCAGDYKFYFKVNDKLEQIPNSRIFPLLKPFANEIYWNKTQDIIHVAQEANNPKQYWIE